MEPPARIRKVLTKLSHDLAIADLRLQNTLAKKIKLTYNDILYLNIIEARSGEYTASQLADMLHVSRPYVTQKINELEQRGCISKQQDPNDKRVHYLFIEESGLPAGYSSDFDIIGNTILAELSQSYSPQQIADFLDMISCAGDIILDTSAHLITT